jgi:N-acetylglutamate synthase-like GNAT family acetyltransferase
MNIELNNKGGLYMITLREINKEEYGEVRAILEKERIKDYDLSKGIVYILIDNNNIIGVGKISLENEYGVLEYIVVKRENRGSNLGDCILRSLLFKAESIGVKEVYCLNCMDYLLGRGFKYNKKKDMGLYKLYLNIEDFFNVKSCGDIDEL